MAGISQTKSYGVSYVIHADSTKLTTALKAAATEADMLQAHLTNAHTKMQALFGTGKDIPQTITKLNEAFNKWANAKSVNQNNPITTTENFVKSVEKAAKKLDKNFKKHPIISQEGLIGEDFLKTLQSQLSAKPLEITVKPILSANAHATLQEQLNTKEFTINVKANVTGIQQQKPGTTAPANSQPVSKSKARSNFSIQGINRAPLDKFPAGIQQAIALNNAVESDLKARLKLHPVQEKWDKLNSESREYFKKAKKFLEAGGSRESEKYKKLIAKGDKAGAAADKLLDTKLSKLQAKAEKASRAYWAVEGRGPASYLISSDWLPRDKNGKIIMPTSQGTISSASSKKPYSSPTAKASLSPIGQMQQSIKQFQNLAKSSPININSRWLGGELAQQVSVSLGNIQNLVNSRPILVRGRWMGGELAQQASMSLGNLQSLVSQRGISVLPKMPDSKGLNKTLADIQKLTSSKPIPIEGKLNTAKINKQIRAFKPSPIAIKANIRWGTGSASKVSQIKKLSEGLKPLPMSVDLDISKAKAKLQQLKTFAASMSPLNIGTTVASGNKGTTQAAVQSQVQRATTASMRASANSGPVASAMMGGRNNDLYTRMRKSWYPFTGNTSFGARTPMALDMAKGMGMMFAVSGVMQAVTSSFHQVAEYENMMKTVQAILKTNDSGANFNGRFKAMEEEVRRVGRETKFTAPEVAGAARFMAMAGLGIEDINAATNPIANLALVGDNDMSTTADKMTNIMTSFGLLKGLNAAQKKKNMVRASDILTNTFTKSNTDLIQLANAMEYAGTMSYMSGTDLADAAAMVGVMGNSGVQASMAGTSLRMIYRNIMKPTDKQQKEWDKLGVKRFDKNGNFRDIFDILTDLRAAITGSTDINAPLSKNARKRMALSTMDMFRATASSGTAAILMNLGEVINLAKSNREANGVAQTIADEKKNTISGLWAQVTSTFTDQSVNTVSKFTETIKDMLRNIRDWLATDEAAETLRNIYELAGSILDVFKWVIKVWKDIYSIAPGIIQSFIKYQFLLTQLGFLVTPIVQLVGSITTFKNALFGLSGAMTVASASAAQAAKANAIGGASTAALMATNSRASARKIAQFSNIALLVEAVKRNKLTGKQYTLGMAAALHNGMAAGTLNVGGIANTLRAAYAKAGLMLAKGVGMLVSPLGLASLALGGFVFALWRANKALEAAKARFDKTIKQGETTRQRAVDTYYNKGGISSSIIEDPTKYMNKVLAEKKIHFSAGRSGKDFIANPLLKNSKEWKAAFLEDNSFISGQPAYDKGTYEKIIRPFTQSWFGKDMSLQEFQRTEMQRSGMTFTQRYGSIHNAVSQLRDRAIITQVALSSKTFQNARNQAIKAWRDYANLDKSKQTTEAKEAAKNKVMNIAKGFQDKANYANIITGKKNNNIGNMRISDVANSREGLEVMTQNIMSLNNPNNSVTAIMQAGKIVRDNVRIYQKQLQQIAGAIPMQIRNIHGQLVNFKLPIGNNGVDWNALMTQFRILGVKFQNGIQGQMGMMLQMFNIVQDNAELAAKYAGMTAGQLANAISPINIGDTVNKNDWKPWVMLWAEKNQRLIKKMGFKDASDFFNENTKKTTQKWSKNAWYLQQIRANALNTSTGNAKVTNKNVGNGNTKEINPPAGTDQSAYDSKYNNHQARPTQIIFNIDQLCKFEGTQVNSLDQKGIAESVGRQMAEGLHLMFAQAASDFAIIGDSNG